MRKFTVVCFDLCTVTAGAGITFCFLWRTKFASLDQNPYLNVFKDSQRVQHFQIQHVNRVKERFYCNLLSLTGICSLSPSLKEQRTFLDFPLPSFVTPLPLPPHPSLPRRLLRQLDAALSFHSRELTLRKDLADPQGECRALGRLAAVHMALGDYTTTFQCYEAQLGLAQGLRDARLEAEVHGNMGITKMNMAMFEEAIGYFEQQLAMLQQLSGSEGMLDRGRAYGSLADCYDALGDYEEAIQYCEKYLTVAQSLNHVQDQEKAYRGLGNAHRSVAAGGRKTSKTCSLFGGVLAVLGTSTLLPDLFLLNIIVFLFPFCSPTERG